MRRHQHDHLHTRTPQMHELSSVPEPQTAAPAPKARHSHPREGPARGDSGKAASRTFTVRTRRALQAAQNALSCCSRERAREKTRGVGGDRSRPRPRHAQRAARRAAHVHWLRSQLLFRDSSSEGPFSWLRRSHLMSHEKPPAFFVGKRSPPAHHHSAPPTPFSKKIADPKTADSARCAQHQAKAPSRHPIFLFSPLVATCRL